MGEIADSLINGEFDCITGEYLGEPCGFPRTITDPNDPSFVLPSSIERYYEEELDMEKFPFYEKGLTEVKMNKKKFYSFSNAMSFAKAIYNRVYKIYDYVNDNGRIVYVVKYYRDTKKFRKYANNTTT
jgi:hypothetical protein